MKTATHKEATEAYNEMINNGIMPCLEVGESVIHFEPSENGFAFGTVCNVGLLKDGEYEYDVDFDSETNFMTLCEEIFDHYEEA